jgi:hypothetical protein
LSLRPASDRLLATTNHSLLFSALVLDTEAVPDNNKIQNLKLWLKCKKVSKNPIE